MKYRMTIRAILFSAKRKYKPLPGILLGTPKKTDVAWGKLWKHLEAAALKKWQLEWAECEKGAWTKTLLPKPGLRSEPPSFSLEHGLSGHRVF
jgi:hypothetical protein